VNYQAMSLGAAVILGLIVFVELGIIVDLRRKALALAQKGSEQISKTGSRSIPPLERSARLPWLLLAVCAVIMVAYVASSEMRLSRYRLENEALQHEIYAQRHGTAVAPIPPKTLTPVNPPRAGK
jgi:hypothetical protein